MAGFRYVPDLLATLEPWRDKLGLDFDPVVAHLTDRDRQLEDYISRLLPTAASVVATETTTSSSYTDLATAGPAVTVAISTPGSALVTVTATIQVGSAGVDQEGFMSFAISGATTRAADDATALVLLDSNPSATTGMSASAVFLVTGLTAGSNTFTAKYRNFGGVNPAYFARRFIIVQPL